MTARHSPAVHYPLQRPVLLWCIWKWVSVLSAALLLMWLWLGAGQGLLLAALAAVVCWVLEVWAVHCSLLRLPQGHLHWDGKCWSLVQGGGSSAVLVSLRVIAEMQQLLVLRLECQQGRSCHVLLEKKWAPERWLDLRRAVYSSAYLSQPHQQSGAA